LWTDGVIPADRSQAIHDGYEIYVARTAAADVSQLAHEQRHEGVWSRRVAKPVTALSVMLEWQPRLGAQGHVRSAGMDIVKTHCGAYGVGVEYA